MAAEVVGKIKNREIDLLGLTFTEGTAILSGPQNLRHMQDEHPEDYRKYGHHLKDIIASPDYVSLHPKDKSIQYIKEFFEDGAGDRVLVAVRTTQKGICFARTLFVMSEEKWKHYNAKGYIKKY